MHIPWEKLIATEKFLPPSDYVVDCKTCRWQPRSYSMHMVLYLKLHPIVNL